MMNQSTLSGEVTPSCTLQHLLSVIPTWQLVGKSFAAAAAAIIAAAAAADVAAVAAAALVLTC